MSHRHRWFAAAFAAALVGTFISTSWADEPLVGDPASPASLSDLDTDESFDNVETSTVLAVFNEDDQVTQRGDDGPRRPPEGGPGGPPRRPEGFRGPDRQGPPPGGPRSDGDRPSMDRGPGGPDRHGPPHGFGHHGPPSGDRDGHKGPPHGPPSFAHHGH